MNPKPDQTIQSLYPASDDRAFSLRLYAGSEQEMIALHFPTVARPKEAAANNRFSDFRLSNLRDDLKTSEKEN